MMKWMLGCLAALLLGNALQAHFLFVIPTEKPGKYAIVFSDKLAPDDPALIEKIKHAKVWVHDSGSSHKDLKHTIEGAKLVVEPPSGAKTIRFSCCYGVFQRGENPAQKLNYYGAYAASGMVESGCISCQPLQVEQTSNTEFIVKHDDDELANTEVVVMGPEGFEERKLKTDAKGKVKVDLTGSPAGLYALRAKHTKKEEGEYQGKKFSQETSYFTLVFKHEVKVGIAPLQQLYSVALIGQQQGVVQNEVAQLKDQIAKLQEENQKLKAQLNRIKSLIERLNAEFGLGSVSTILADKTLEQWEEELLLRKSELGPNHPTVKLIQDKIEVLKKAKK